MLFVIDRINNAMAFIAHSLTLSMLLVLAALTIANALFLLNGAKKLSTVRKGCAYGAMILALVYAVLFIVVKTDENAMSRIIDRELTKAVILAMGALSFAVSVFMLSRERRLLRRRLQKQRSHKHKHRAETGART